MDIQKQVNSLLYKLAVLACVISFPANAGLDDDLIILAKEAHSMFPVDVPFSMPKVVFEEPKDMYERVCGTKCPPGLRIIGMYRANTLTLRKDFNGQNNFDSSYFIHEMIHHFQEAAENLHEIHEEETCESRFQLEMQAYLIQNQWLMKRGQGIPMRVINELSRASSYGCMNQKD